MQNQKRVVIDRVYPSVNGGVYPIKRVVNQLVDINADILTDGHDVIQASILYKHEKDTKWKEVRMQPTHNDEWIGSFRVEKQGYYSYKIQGWVDYALNWQHGTVRKIEDDQIVISELLEGKIYLNEIKSAATQLEQKFLSELETNFENKSSYDKAIKEVRGQKLHKLFSKYPQKVLVNESDVYQVYVDRIKAEFSTWYEFFPRSSSVKNDSHGTFKDCEKLLDRVSKMGFDTLYFPPIHPIGEVNRKGKNNTTEAKSGDVGSCWGIGSGLGGHKDIHPELGSLEDFKNLIHKANGLGIEIAMDYALQAAPDHPWVKSNPDWFKWRPDGSVQYAENPPKKYQDILPIYFETADYKNLWKECLDILLFWIDCGIKIFRVDNPHTKPFYFWNWIISEVKKVAPDVLFLAEAFTRPKIMTQLAKQGFTQSYTYFTWRDSKHELMEYVEELTQSEQREYMKPNFWPNTPDINPFHLQGANESKYLQRYALAATLSSNTGIYGPVFEYMMSDALSGREEYLNSEKFQITHYDWTKENWIINIISKINQTRKSQKALQQTKNIKFCNVQNDKLLAFYKWDDDKTNEVIVVISLDHEHSQRGTVQLPHKELGLHNGSQIAVHDLIPGNDYTWNHEWNYVELHPNMPFHIFEIKK